MHLRPTDDEMTLDEVFAAFCVGECPIERVRAAEPLGHDGEVWRRLTETGAPGMALPGTVGGADANLATAAIVARHVGRHLAPVPVIEHVAASRLLARLAPDHPHLAELAAGSAIATLALNEVGLVPAGAVADVVLSPDEGGVAVTVANPSGIAAPNTAHLPLARVDLADAVRVAEDGWDRGVAEWQALMATALCGLGRRAVEIGVDYTKGRYQFGVPVGSFQGVQHGLATVVTAIEGATLLASRAIWALDASTPEAHDLASMAFLFAAEAAQDAAAASLQYHGGYGYAEEYDIQLYYRRARGWALQFGDPGSEYQCLAARLLPRAG